MITHTSMSNGDWTLRIKHREWYYVRVRITGNEKPDLTTWKLVIQKCLQQKQGVFGGSIEFDILENDVIKGFETVIRVHFQDRQDFVESISTCVFDEDNVNFHGGRSLRIIAQSASLDGVVVPRHGWEQQEPN